MEQGNRDTRSIGIKAAYDFSTLGETGQNRMFNRSIGSSCVDDVYSLSSSLSENDLAVCNNNGRISKLRSTKTIATIDLSKTSPDKFSLGWENHWPNSLEDPERDNKSSTIALVSTSLSDCGDINKHKVTDVFGENSLISTNTYQSITRQQATESLEGSNEFSDCESEINYKDTDSLPRHRERLSRRKRNRKRGSYTKLVYSSSSNSSSISAHEVTSYGDKPKSGDAQRRHSRTTPDAVPLVQEVIRETPESNAEKKCPRQRRNVCGSDNLYSTIDTVGSWLALQRFPPCQRPSTITPPINNNQPLRSKHDVIFNVSGQLFIVDTRTLSRFPNTMLGCKQKRAKYWDEKRNEYFLDRHRATFEVMLNFYKSDEGVLLRPDEIPIDVFIHEIKYYQFDREIIQRFLEMEGILRQVKKQELPDNPVKREIWKLFEYPDSSAIARFVTSTSAIVIALSICVFCVETVPMFKSWGNRVNESIGPAVESCQYLLANKSSLFHPETGLFKAHEQELVANDSNKMNVKKLLKRSIKTEGSLKWLQFEPIPPRVSFFHQIKDDFEITDMPTTSVIDSFDSNSVINTLQSMLQECIKIEPNNSYKYFITRCAVELDDGLYYRKTTPIHHILSQIEVHDEDHEHEHEDKHWEDYDDHEEKESPGSNHPFKNPNSTTLIAQRKILKKNLNKNNSYVGYKANVVKNPRRKRYLSNQYNITDKLSLKQSARALTHVCRELDVHSVRSSYAWFVLEASLDGPAGLLFLIESGCIVWFVIELGLRFVCCPNRTKFCVNFLNIIDAVAIMPYFITLIVTSLHTDSNIRPKTATILRTIRLVRMLRILKLSRHSRGLRILGRTLLRSTRVLVLLVCFEMVLAVTFSSIVYNVELGVKGSYYKSIPDAFWWALITMTTVGYGDVVPQNVPGKLTGAFCAIMGILGIAFPVPVIVSNFNYLYNLDRDDCKLDPEELMTNEEEEEKQNPGQFGRFEESLFEAVRKNVGSMSAGPTDNSSGGNNPADLWNQTRRQYKSTTTALADKRADKRRRSAESKRLAKGVTAFATASIMSTAMPLGSNTGRKERNEKATSI